jgi:hypothetical protein
MKKTYQMKFMRIYVVNMKTKTEFYNNNSEQAAGYTV